jgi:hypothetical protein
MGFVLSATEYLVPVNLCPHQDLQFNMRLFERAKTFHALYGAAIVICHYSVYSKDKRSLCYK